MHNASDEPRPQAPWQKDLREGGRYAGLGMQLALSMAFFVVVGYFLDRWLGTSPWLLVGGAVVGMAAIFVQLFRTVGEMNRQSEARRRRKEETQERGNGL